MGRSGAKAKAETDILSTVEVGPVSTCRVLFVSRALKLHSHMSSWRQMHEGCCEITGPGTAWINVCGDLSKMTPARSEASPKRLFAAELRWEGCTGIEGFGHR